METELANGGNQVDENGSGPGLAGVPNPTTPEATSEAQRSSPSDLSIDEVDRLLDEVEAALSRLDDGTYGTCSACGGQIDDGSLAASPTTRTCEACSAPAIDPAGPVAGPPPRN